MNSAGWIMEMLRAGGELIPRGMVARRLRSGKRIDFRRWLLSTLHGSAAGNIFKRVRSQLDDDSPSLIRSLALVPN